MFAAPQASGRRGAGTADAATSLGPIGKHRESLEANVAPHEEHERRRERREKADPHQREGDARAARTMDRPHTARSRRRCGTGPG
jgi:hypothetical protein